MIDEKLRKTLELFNSLKPNWTLDDQDQLNPSDDFNSQHFEMATEDGLIHGRLSFGFRSPAYADIMLRGVHVCVYLYPPGSDSSGSIVIFDGDYREGSEEYDLLKSFRNSLSVWQPIKAEIEKKRELTDKIRNKYLK